MEIFVIKYASVLLTTITSEVSTQVSGTPTTQMKTSLSLHNLFHLGFAQALRGIHLLPTLQTTNSTLGTNPPLLG
jgi:hypothetical protein